MIKQKNSSGLSEHGEVDRHSGLDNMFQNATYYGSDATGLWIDLASAIVQLGEKLLEFDNNTTDLRNAILGRLGRTIPFSCTQWNVRGIVPGSAEWGYEYSEINNFGIIENMGCHGAPDIPLILIEDSIYKFINCDNICGFKFNAFNSSIYFDGTCCLADDEVYYGISIEYVHLIGIVIDRVAFYNSFGINILQSHHLPPLEKIQSQQSTLRVKGGRPAKKWWDDLWAEIARQLYCGDLKPNKQADIEKAMLCWLSSKGYETSEATIRPAARRLFSALTAEDQN